MIRSEQMTDHPIPQEDGGSIVVVGDLNPAIFHPSWLASHGLVSNSEAERTIQDERQLAVTRHVTAYQVGAFAIQVTDERFSARTIDPSYLLPLRDLVVGVFRVLEQTPVRQMGMNRHSHFKVDSEDAWHMLGDALAPKDRWRDLFQAEPRLGLRTLVIEGKAPNSDAKFVRIKVEPSARVTPWGIFFETNEHYESAGSAEAFVTVLADRWEGAMEYSMGAMRHVLLAPNR